MIANNARLRKDAVNAVRLLVLVAALALSGCASLASYERALTTGDQAATDKNYADAIRAYRIAKLANPSAVSPTIKLAELYVELRRPHDALRELQNAQLRIDEGLSKRAAAESTTYRAEAWFLAGNAHEQLNQLTSAVALYERSLLLAPVEKQYQRALLNAKVRITPPLLGDPTVRPGSDPPSSSPPPISIKRPTIEIDIEALPAVTSISTVFISGIVQDMPGIGKVLVNGIPAILRPGAGSRNHGGGSFVEFVSEVNLAPGDNPISIVVQTAAGTSPPVEISIRRVQVPQDNATRPSLYGLFIVAPRASAGIEPTSTGVLPESLALVERLKAGISAGKSESPIGEVATRKTILGALDAFAKLENVDEALIYIDMEASLVRVGQETHVHLMPADVQRGRIADSSIAAGEIFGILQRHKAKRLIVLFNTEYGAQLIQNNPLNEQRARTAFVTVAAADRMFVLEDFGRTPLFLSQALLVLDQASLSRERLSFFEFIGRTGKQVESQSGGTQKVYSAGNPSYAETFVATVGDPTKLYLDATGQLGRTGQISRRALMQANGVLLRGLGTSSSQVAVLTILRKYVQKEITAQQLNDELVAMDGPRP
jgi:tetratricopeptide (TPR) repeat protein